MGDKPRILVVEDDRVIKNFISTILDLNGYAVIQAATGTEALSMLVSHAADLVLLDLGLPDLDGMEVLCNIREWSEIPVIIVSARQGEHDKVAALDAGANDYITKPFGNNELLARIRNALRQHAKIQNGRDAHNNTFTTRGLEVDYIRRLVTVEDKPVHLTPIEYRILVLLATNAGKVLTHDYILREIWGPYGNDRQVLWVNMANIRRKIEADPATPQYILTEVGVGYRLNGAESAE